jgi:hypothetical protein
VSDDDPIAHLDFDVDEPVVQDLTELDDLSLSRLEGMVRRDLHHLGEMQAPPSMRSERGAELHSQYTAIQIEKNRRGW